MGARGKTMYVAQQLMTRVGTNFGDLQIVSVTDGVVGVLPVFRTKTAARNWYGRDVKLIQIEFDAASV